MGAGIAASPHLHRAKDLPVFASLAAFAPRSSILAHQLRRRFRWWSSPKAGSVIFRGPSWVGPFAPPAPRGSRELRLEDQLFRRLFRWSELSRSSPHRRPVEIGSSVTCRYLPAVAGLPLEAGTSVPITHVTCSTLPSRESEKNESKPVDNGDIAHNCRIPFSGANDPIFVRCRSFGPGQARRPSQGRIDLHLSNGTGR